MLYSIFEIRVIRLILNSTQLTKMPFKNTTFALNIIIYT